MSFDCECRCAVWLCDIRMKFGRKFEYETQIAMAREHCCCYCCCWCRCRCCLSWLQLTHTYLQTHFDVMHWQYVPHMHYDYSMSYSVFTLAKSSSKRQNTSHFKLVSYFVVILFRCFSFFCFVRCRRCHCTSLCCRSLVYSFFFSIFVAAGPGCCVCAARWRHRWHINVDR